MAGNANPYFEKALAFAAQAHGAVKQERKGTDFPYIAHPIRVAEILDRFECSEDVIVAGFLHDTIETRMSRRTRSGKRSARASRASSPP